MVVDVSLIELGCSGPDTAVLLWIAVFSSGAVLLVVCGAFSASGDMEDDMAAVARVGRVLWEVVLEVLLLLFFNDAVDY